MKQLINTQKQYNQTHQYFIKYINTLLNKRHITHKGLLQQIQYDLTNIGHIRDKYQYKFLLKFLISDKKHSNINITDHLYSLESFIKNQQQSTSISLEEFLT